MIKNSMISIKKSPISKNVNSRKANQREFRTKLACKLMTVNLGHWEPPCGMKGCLADSEDITWFVIIWSLRKESR
jgi:hypothetical protein